MSTATFGWMIVFFVAGFIVGDEARVRRMNKERAKVYDLHKQAKAQTPVDDDDGLFPFETP